LKGFSIRELLPGLSANPPDYERYDYRKEWRRKEIEDLAEKRILTKWIKQPIGSCLELGSGFGRLTVLFQNHSQEIVTIDFSEANLHQTKNTAKRAQVIRSTVQELPFRDNSFDYIFLIRVVHHLPDPQVVLKEISRVARPDATLILSAPNQVFGKNRKLRSNTLVAEGDHGHRIYSAPLGYYSLPEFLREEERRGTGIFENRIGLALRRLEFLHLVDAISAPAWFLKPIVFVKYRIVK
jgi:2-polyprenyl-3-methyl-5-hydroxy-6-metoxy-1,4-benzoquinol methylase